MVASSLHSQLQNAAVMMMIGILCQLLAMTNVHNAAGVMAMMVYQQTSLPPSPPVCYTSPPYERTQLNQLTTVTIAININIIILTKSSYVIQLQGNLCITLYGIAYCASANIDNTDDTRTVRVIENQRMELR